MIAYKCLTCGCIHGWENHRLIKKVTKHIRGAWEDIWYCPYCGEQFRTNDGTMFGQLHKRWKEISIAEALEEEKWRYFEHYGIIVDFGDEITKISE